VAALKPPIKKIDKNAKERRLAMPAITDRSTEEPLLGKMSMNHGTLACRDIAKTRRFYEEVLGLDVVQGSPVSLMVRKGANYVYAVVEAPIEKEGSMLNHNGFEVATAEEVDAAYRKLLTVKEEWGLKIMPPRTLHGDHTFYFLDFDGNWWEIVSIRKGGYIADFSDKDWDLTGRHYLDSWCDLYTKEKKLMHMHDPEARALAKEAETKV
jgi:catechol 2,3-dioxygenase-like lactoylglutathione lyase family enzyme